MVADVSQEGTHSASNDDVSLNVQRQRDHVGDVLSEGLSGRETSTEKSEAGQMYTKDCNFVHRAKA